MTTITHDGVTITLTKEQLAEIEAQRQDKPYELEYPVDSIGRTFRLFGTGQVSLDQYKTTDFFEQGNIFNTAKEAERERDYRALNMRVTQFIARENKRLGWVCDWSDKDQVKYFCFYRQGVKLDYWYNKRIKPTSHYFHEDVYELLQKSFSEAELISWTTFGEL